MYNRPKPTRIIPTTAPRNVYKTNTGNAAIDRAGVAMQRLIAAGLGGEGRRATHMANVAIGWQTGAEWTDLYLTIIDWFIFEVKSM